MKRYVAFLRSESELDWKPIDNALGSGTMRTMGTVEQIASRYCSG